MALKSTCKTLAKVSDDEEMFVLRAQDATAADVVLLGKNFWSAPEEKLHEAFECAIKMRRYKSKKMAD